LLRNLDLELARVAGAHGGPLTLALVVFELAEAAGGILLTVVESGLDQIPFARRATVLRLNTSGWDEQMRNIEKHVAAS